MLALVKKTINIFDNKNVEHMIKKTTTLCTSEITYKLLSSVNIPLLLYNCIYVHKMLYHWEYEIKRMVK